VTVPPRTGIAYVRHLIPLTEPRDITQIRDALASLPDIVVNISASAGGPSVALSDENLAAALAEPGRTLAADALPDAVYFQIMSGKIAEAIGESEAFRGTLASHSVAELGAGADRIARHLEQIHFLLRGYALQRPQAGLNDSIQELERLRDQFVRSAFEHFDNVRCMDDLHYEIVPALQGIASMFSSEKGGTVL
jgi:hypothetical protein